MQPPPKVVVAGGGWAGIAAAVELTAHGIPVTVLESSRQLGGRARRIPFGGDGVDNGQHLLIGAYRETLHILSQVGVTEESAFLRRPLRLELRGRDGTLTMTAPNLPAPLHLAAALLRAQGLSTRERIQTLRMTTGFFLRNFRVEPDLTVAELLIRQSQSARVRAMLWEPLCIATLNTPAEHASAAFFLRVLRDGMVRHARGSDLLFARQDLGKLLPEPAMHYIERHGGQVRLGARVTELEMVEGRVAGVRVGKEHLPCGHLVLAVPPAAAARLLSGHEMLATTAHQLSRIPYQPIVTVYLRYPPETQLEREMVGLVDTTGQWVFDRRIYGQPGLMAVVISGPGPHMKLGRDELAQLVAGELAEYFPHWPAPFESLVVREKRATFSCEPGVEKLRPDQRTAIRGCWLAGDHTATPYPATLEGAVLSGVQCARHIVADWEKQYI